MKHIDSGFLPIGKDDRLVGTITDRDLVVKCLSIGRGQFLTSWNIEFELIINRPNKN